MESPGNESQLFLMEEQNIIASLHEFDSDGQADKLASPEEIAEKVSENLMKFIREQLKIVAAGKHPNVVSR